MPNEMIAVDTERVRVAVFEEHELYRAGLCLLLAERLNLELVGHASTWPEAVALVHREQPDIFLHTMGEGESARIELLPEILAASDRTRILALTASNDPELHRQVIRSGAAGVLSKDKPPTMLIKAIECVNAGEAWLDRSTTATLLRELSRGKNTDQTPDQIKIASLSQRERDVIKLVGHGLKNQQIAERLFISTVTVHHHLTSIYSKLEVADRLELLIYAYRHGLAEIPR